MSGINRNTSCTEVNISETELFANLMFLCWYFSTKRVARPHLRISQVVSVLFSQLGKAVGQEEEKEVNFEQTRFRQPFEIE